MGQTTIHARGDNGDEYDNNALIAEISEVEARASRTCWATATMPNGACKTEWRKHQRMPLGLMEAVWPAAIATGAGRG